MVWIHKPRKTMFFFLYVKLFFRDPTIRTWKRISIVPQLSTPTRSKAEVVTEEQEAQQEGKWEGLKIEGFSVSLFLLLCSCGSAGGPRGTGRPRKAHQRSEDDKHFHEANPWFSLIFFFEGVGKYIQLGDVTMGARDLVAPSGVDPYPEESLSTSQENCPVTQKWPKKHHKDPKLKAHETYVCFVGEYGNRKCPTARKQKAPFQGSRKCSFDGES